MYGQVVNLVARQLSIFNNSCSVFPVQNALNCFLGILYVSCLDCGAEKGGEGVAQIYLYLQDVSLILVELT